MHLVKCDYRYWDFVKELRSHPTVQSGFIDQVQKIEYPDQTRYMSKNWENFWVLLDDNTCYGYIGLIGPHKNEITYCVHPKYQGNGYGTIMVENLISRIQNISIWAKVKCDNIASCKVFEKINYFKNKYIYEHKKICFNIYSESELNHTQIKSMVIS